MLTIMVTTYLWCRSMLTISRTQRLMAARMNGLNDLQGMNILAVAAKMKLHDDEFEDWLVVLGLLHARQLCERCHQDMVLENHKNSRRWVCNRRACRKGTRDGGGTKKKKGFKVGTYFKGSNLSCKKIFLLSYFWVHDLGTMDHQMFKWKYAAKQPFSGINTSETFAHNTFYSTNRLLVVLVWKLKSMRHAYRRENTIGGDWYVQTNGCLVELSVSQKWYYWCSWNTETRIHYCPSSKNT